MVVRRNAFFNFFKLKFYFKKKKKKDQNLI
jgi:hypothetical protein